MRDPDFDQFSAMLDDVAALLKPREPLTATARAMFFRALAPLSLHQVRSALDAHVRDAHRGRFFPTPADVLAQSSDDRPGADEAWAIAIRGCDEAVSIVWTDEISEAWGIARPVLQLGDEVGARVAFRDAYVRLVNVARTAGNPAHWCASLGHDPEGREVALREEARLTGSLFAALEGPKRGGDPLLPLMTSDSMPVVVRERLAAIRAQITGEVPLLYDAAPGEDAIAKARTKAASDRSTARVKEYAAAMGIDLTPRPLPPQRAEFVPDWGYEGRS